MTVEDFMASTSTTRPHGSSTNEEWTRLPEPILVTHENFKPYGEVIEADTSPHYKDAQLNLSNGVPRFYLMNLERTKLTFHEITRHRQTTQVLGSVGGLDWYMAVCAPTDRDLEEAQPDMETLQVFFIPGDKAIKLSEGTWHAGPLFEEPERALFYNLELMDTNINDHQTVSLGDKRFLFHDYLGEGSQKRKKD